MPYITLPELAERPGATEIAQVAGPRHLPPVDPALMDATLRGGDRTGWQQPAIDAADAAKQRVSDAVAEAVAIIDGYVRTGGYQLPLVEPLPPSAKSILTAWARAIARYLLNQGRVIDPDKDPITRDYKDALKLLQLCADGKFRLGELDALQPNASSTDVRFAGAAPVFGRDQLHAFR